MERHCRVVDQLRSLSLRRVAQVKPRIPGSRSSLSDSWRFRLRGWRNGSRIIFKSPGLHPCVCQNRLAPLTPEATFRENAAIGRMLDALYRSRTAFRCQVLISS